MTFTPNYLSQRDPRWADEKLGFDDAITIGTDGSTLVCLTMLINGYGLSETPSSMNRMLKDLGSGIGFLGGLIVWPGLTRAFPTILFSRIIVCRDQPAPLDEINDSLDSGQPLLIELDGSPSPGLQNHWVVLVARQGDDYLMLDPWPQVPQEPPASLATRYGIGRPLDELITGAVWYAFGGTPAPAPESASTPGRGLFVRVQAGVTSGLRLRSRPATSADILAVETPGTLLHCLEPETSALPKIGAINQWLQVRDPGGLEGFVAAWYVDQFEGSVSTPVALPPFPVLPAQPLMPEITPPSTPPTRLLPLNLVVSQSVGPVGSRLRDQPDTDSNTLAVLSTGAELSSLEPADQALLKVGQANQWLKVRNRLGIVGFVAASHVEARNAPAPLPASQPLTVLVSSQASAGLHLRDRPSEHGNILEVLMPGTLLTVLDPATTARAKIGVVNQWLNVKLPGGMTGFVAAWYVTT